MRELTLRVETPTICINGNPYPLLLSDLELYTRAQALLAQCAGLEGGERAPQAVLAAAQAAAALLDEALGAGATRAISGGAPVSLSLALEWLGALAREAAEHYAALAVAED